MLCLLDVRLAEKHVGACVSSLSWLAATYQPAAVNMSWLILRSVYSEKITAVFL